MNPVNSRSSSPTGTGPMKSHACPLPPPGIRWPICISSPGSPFLSRMQATRSSWSMARSVRSSLESNSPARCVWMNRRPLKRALPTLSDESSGRLMRSLIPTTTCSTTPLRLTTRPTCLAISLEISIMFLALSKVMTAPASIFFRPRLRSRLFCRRFRPCTFPYISI